jgi:hypothetical protein
MSANTVDTLVGSEEKAEEKQVLEWSHTQVDSDEEYPKTPVSIGGGKDCNNDLDTFDGLKYLIL